MEEIASSFGSRLGLTGIRNEDIINMIMDKGAKPTWQNLIFGQCPLCAAKLRCAGILEPTYFCSDEKCAFSICEKTYQSIMNDRSKRQNRALERFSGQYEDPEDREIARMSYNSKE